MEAFTELLSIYESLGEELPLVQQYEAIFSKDSDMKRVLAYLYKDVLEFHHRALKYFQQPSMRSFLTPPTKRLSSTWGYMVVH